MSVEPALVSVIIPTHNRAHLVSRAIRSVLDQTYEDLELIVVDDASTDDTDEVVKAFKDPRLHYVRHQDNRGANAARNTGIRNSKGSYIGFLDSDDEWLPKKLEKQVQVFGSSGPEVGLVYTGMQLVDQATGDVLGTCLPQHRGLLLRKLLLENIVGSTSTALLCQSFLDRTGGFDERLPARQDADLWIRLARHCAFDYVQEALVRIYAHPDRITSDRDARVAGAKLVFEKIRGDLEQDRQLLSEGHHFVARELCQAGRMREARQHLRKAIGAYPFRLKYYGATLISFLGPDRFSRLQSKWVALKRIID